MNNFEHGMYVCSSSGGGLQQHYRVHAPRWWNLWAHVVWLMAVLRKRTGRMTLSTGEELRLLAGPMKSTPKED